MVNKQLADKNTRIEQAFGMRGTVPNVMIKTEKLDDSKRVKPCNIFASFCPFCGAEYPKQS
jgi:hypothetical protein